MTEEIPTEALHSEPAAEEPGSGHGRTRLVAIGIGALVVAGAAFALVRLQDQDTSALGAVPADAHIVLTADLLQLTDSERISAFVAAFAEPIADAGYIDDADVDVVDNLVKEVEKELGLDLGEDVLSWIGRSVALAIWFPDDMFDSGALSGAVPLEAEPDVLLVVAVTDRSAADEFLRGLDDFVETSARGNGDEYRFSGQSGEIVWLGDGFLLVGSGEAAVSRSLDLGAGASILDDESFGDVVDRLPGDRLLAGFVSGEFFESLAQATGEASQAAGLLDDVRGAGFSVSLPDIGLRVDAVQVLADAAEAAGDHGVLEAVDRLPEDTVGFVAGSIAEGSVAEAVAGLREIDPDAYDETLAQLSVDLGVDIENELLPSIGGEMLLAVVPDTMGLLPVEAGVDIGILLSVGLADPAPMSRLMTAMEFLLSESMGLVVVPGEPVEVLGGDQPYAAYQVTDDALVVGSSRDVVSGYIGGTGGLGRTELFGDLDRALPGSGLSLFIDMGRLFDLLQMSPEDRAIAAPIRAIGASSTRADGIVTGAFMVLIDYLP